MSFMQMGVANRDIKLENTLLMDTSDKPVLKLCDFGYSKDELCASISKTMCGKCPYTIGTSDPMLHTLCCTSMLHTSSCMLYFAFTPTWCEAMRGRVFRP